MKHITKTKNGTKVVVDYSLLTNNILDGTVRLQSNNCEILDSFKLNVSSVDIVTDVIDSYLAEQDY